MRPLSSRGKNWIWLPHKIRAESFERAPSSGGTCCSLLPPRERYVSLKRERERRGKKRKRERRREGEGGREMISVGCIHCYYFIFIAMFSINYTITCSTCVRTTNIVCTYTMLSQQTTTGYHMTTTGLPYVLNNI